MTEKNLIVRNRAGIHARPAALIAQTATKFACEVIMIKVFKVVLSFIIMVMVYLFLHHSVNYGSLIRILINTKLLV